MEFKIIKFVSANPILYEKQFRTSRYSEEKVKKWRELADEIGVPAMTLRKRWKTLRDKYYRDKKLRNHPIFGSTGLRTKWKYYKMMNFLDDYDSCEDYKFGYEDTQAEPEIEYFDETTQQVSESNEDISKFIDVMEELPTSPNNISSKRSFFLSLALQVEEANLPQENFFRLQKRLLEVVQDELRLNSSY